MEAEVAGLMLGVLIACGVALMWVIAFHDGTRA
jgi:hypothetical protein